MIADYSDVGFLEYRTWRGCGRASRWRESAPRHGCKSKLISSIFE